MGITTTNINENEINITFRRPVLRTRIWETLNVRAYLNQKFTEWIKTREEYIVMLSVWGQIAERDGEMPVQFHKNYVDTNTWYERVLNGEYGNGVFARLENKDQDIMSILRSQNIPHIYISGEVWVYLKENRF